MKFTDGYWRNRNDFNIYNVAEVYDIKIENDALSLLCPHFNIQNRGQTLCGPLLNITLSSPMENIISVKIEHYKGLIDKGPNYNLNKTTAYKATVKQINDEYTIKVAS